MTISIDKYNASNKSEVIVSYDKPLFDMDKLAAKSTITKYDKYFKSLQDNSDSFLDEIELTLDEIDHDLKTGNTTTSFKEAWKTGKLFLLQEMSVGSVYDIN